MNSGNADVVPLVASEKNVDACVVSSVFDSVYDDWNDEAAAPAAAQVDDQRVVPGVAVAALQLDRREAPCSGRGVPAGMNGVPSA